MSDKRKTRWSTFTPEQKAEHIRKMQEGRLKSKQLNKEEEEKRIERKKQRTQESLAEPKRPRGRPAKVKEETQYVPIEVIVDNVNIFEHEGKKYRKLGSHDVIKEGAVHTLKIGTNVGTFHPLSSVSTVGKMPSDFFKHRTFYNLIEERK